MNFRLATLSIFRIPLLLVCVLPLAVSAQTSAVQPIHNVVLVHGAWADGSSWSKVVPLLEKRGLHVVCVQNPLTSFAEDVAATKRIIDAQDGPVLLIGHSYGGAVITEAGNDPKVAGLVYVAAFAPDKGESAGSLGKPYGATPGVTELRPLALCANIGETSRPSTITVGRGKKSHIDQHQQDKLFFCCVGSFGA